MRAGLAFGLLLVPVLLAGVTGNGGADENLCAQTFGEVTLGIGDLGSILPVPGLAYEDVAFHPCSNGGYWLDEESGDVAATRLCDQGVVRVWAVTGGAGEDFIINWKSAGVDDCP